MHIDPGWLEIAGAVLLAYCFWIGYEQWRREGGKPETLKLFVALALVVCVGGPYMFGRGFFRFYGMFAIAGGAYYVGRAVINQAHGDLKPEESDSRRRTYAAVQVAVAVGLFLGVSWLLGLDWLSE